MLFLYALFSFPILLLQLDLHIWLGFFFNALILNTVVYLFHCLKVLSAPEVLPGNISTALGVTCT